MIKIGVASAKLTDDLTGVDWHNDASADHVDGDSNEQNNCANFVLTNS